MAGGIATIKQLSDPAVYLALEARSKQFFDGIQTLIDRSGVPVQLQRVGSLFAIIFAAHPIRNYTDSLAIDAKAYARFFQSLLKDGIYMVPSSIDAACISMAHSEEEIDYTIEKIALAFRAH
jgi:glutamate-1-semialdehyde 2,1-aminomutase